MRLLCLPLLFLAAVVSSQTTKPLTEQNLVEMHRAGFDEPTIVEAIKANGVAIDSSAAGLVALKSAGLSDAIIRAALASQGSGNTTPAAAPKPESTVAVPEEVGVYRMEVGKLILLDPEIVSLRTSGFPMFGRNFNGSLQKSSSSNRVPLPATFVIYCADGSSANEYQLLRLEVKKDRREFRALRAGAFGRTKAGGGENLVPVEFQRIGPRLYRVTLEKVSPGEYGWLPPGSADMTRLMSGGAKMHSFRIPD